MSNYVLSFRSNAGQSADPEHEAAWGAWFEQIGASVVDFGHRVGRATLLGSGNSPAGTVLSGYVVINAESFDAATTLAQGCPGLAHGGAVEVGEALESAS
jgi:hypothetical protein